MGRTGTIVYKYDQSGNLIHTYSSFIKAYKGERTSFGKMRVAIDRGMPINGFTFTIGRRCTLPPREKTTNNPAPWEGKNGMFNEETWRSVCF